VVSTILALGALRDVGHGLGDLADGAAGLVGGRGHLLRRRRYGAGGDRDVADQAAQRLARGVVGAHRGDRAGPHLVEARLQAADLVAGGVLDLRRRRDDLDGQVAVRHRLERVAHVRDVGAGEPAHAIEQDLHATRDAERDRARRSRRRGVRQGGGFGGRVWWLPCKRLGTREGSLL
jgi:hypothetical protein